MTLKTKKNMIALLLLLGVGVNCQAQQRLIVWQKNGEKIYYNLADQPKTTFAGTDMVITTTNVTVTYPINNIRSYTYEGESTAIPSLTTDDGLYVEQGEDAVTFKNLKSGSDVLLFATNGALLETLKSDGVTPVTISIANRPAGVYVVKANDITYKLLKK